MVSLYRINTELSSHDSSEDREEIESLRQQVNTLKESLKAAKENERSHVEELKKEIDSLNSQFETLKKRSEIQQQKNIGDLESFISEKDITIAQLGATVEALRQQYTDGESARAKAVQDSMVARAASEESEEHLKIAHQHLSKKVRETTELAERLKTVQANLEQVNALNIAKNESIEQLEKSLQIYQSKETLLLKEIQDLKKQNDIRQVEWLSKIASLQRDLDQERGEVERMRVYEERCHHIARYWENMGKILWSHENVKKNASQQRAYHNLFDLAIAPPDSDENSGEL